MKFLKVRLELQVLLRHSVSESGMVIINTEINELVVHFVDDFPACSFVQFLEVLLVSFYIEFKLDQSCDTYIAVRWDHFLGSYQSRLRFLQLVLKI